MAALAVLVEGVVKVDRCPVERVVTAAAGSFVVRLGRFCPVAGKAVGCETCVVDFNLSPLFHIRVAGSARTGQMGFRRILHVANFAFGDAFVCVGGQIPIFCVRVALLAQPRIVKNGRVRVVASFTGSRAVVLVSSQLPGGCVVVAQLAVAGEMSGGNGRCQIIDQNDFWQHRLGQIIRVAARAFSYADVVKLVQLPAVQGVARFTLSGKMIRIDLPQAAAFGDKQRGSGLRWRQGVAVGAGGGCVGILAIFVAAFAGQIGVSGGQGES